MSMPKSVMKINKDGVQFIDSVDKVNYSIKELTRAALRDVGKFCCREFRKNYYSVFKRRKGRVGKYTQYWVRSKQDIPDLKVGVKPSAFYGGFQEFGSSKHEKLGLLTRSVQENIETIIRIESQYLSSLEDEARVLSEINEEDYEGSAED